MARPFHAKSGILAACLALIPVLSASCSGCRSGPQPLACPEGTSEHASPPPDKLERWCAKDDASVTRHGPYERRGRGGKLREKGSFAEGARAGQWVTYDESGKIRARIEYVAGRRSGMAQRYDEKGEVVSAGEYLDGKRDGDWTFFLGGKAAAELRAKVRYVGGLAGTPIYIEDAQGESVPPEAFALGQRDGQVKVPDAKGNTVMEGQVQDGRRQGMWTVFHPGGKPASRAAYRNGRLDGPFAAWDPEGAVIAEGSFASGSLDSIYTDRFNPVSKNLKLLTTLSAPLASDPLRLSSVLVVASKDGLVTAFRPQTATVAWKRPLGPAIAFGPLAAGGSCPVAIVTTDKRLRLLDAENGETCSDIPFDTDQKPALLSGRSEKGLKLVAIGAAGGQVTAVDARDGQLIWSYDSEAPITAGPVVADGEWAEGKRVVVGDSSGKVVWLDLGTGKKASERAPPEDAPGPVVELVASGDYLHVIRRLGQGFALEPFSVGGHREAGFQMDERPKVVSAGSLTVFVAGGQLMTYRATSYGPNVSQKVLPPDVEFQDVFAFESSAYLLASRPAVMLEVEVGRSEWRAASRLPKAMQCQGKRYSVVDGRDGVLYLGCDSSRSLLALSLPLQGSTEAWKVADRPTEQCTESDGILILRPMETVKSRAQGVMAVDSLTGITLWEGSAARPSPAEDFLAVVGPVVIFDHDGRITARSRVSGRVVWEHLLEDETLDGECVSSPAPALPFTPPQPYWDSDPQPPHLARPVVLGATVYVSSSCGVAAFDALTGVLEWVVPSPTPYLTVHLAPTAQGTVVAGNDKGIWALDTSTGRVLWTAASGTSFVVTDDAVVTALDGARLVAYDALTGAVSWLYRPPYREIDGNSPRLSKSQGLVQLKYVANPDSGGEVPYLVMINPQDGAVLASYDAGMVPGADGVLRQPARVSAAVCEGPLNLYSSGAGLVADRTVPLP